jgi:hypothetical protein
MQRVKAHELRTKDEKGLVEELTKFRVSMLKSDLLCRKNWPASESARSPLLPK